MTRNFPGHSQAILRFDEPLQYLNVYGSGVSGYYIAWAVERRRRQVVIVDTSHPNVDWDNLQFESATAVIPVVLPTTADQTATVGDAFSLTLPEATEGTTPYDYTATGLPPGLSFTESNRSISGTPTTAGTYARSPTR